MKQRCMRLPPRPLCLYKSPCPSRRAGFSPGPLLDRPASRRAGLSPGRLSVARGQPSAGQLFGLAHFLGECTLHRFREDLARRPDGNRAEQVRAEERISLHVTIELGAVAGADDHQAAFDPARFVDERTTIAKHVLALRHVAEVVGSGFAPRFGAVRLVETIEYEVHAAPSMIG